MRRGESLAEWCERTERRAAALEIREHFVYRAFDSYGLLLYIGCTVNVKARMGGHRSGPWYRFAETIATVSHPTRSAGFAAERVAIDSEAAYFNSTQADIQRTQANLNAAKSAVGWYPPQVPSDLRFHDDPEAWDAAWDAIAPEHEAWDRAVWRLKWELKATTHPFMTDYDRLDRYRAAREDAELARLEAAAA